LLVAQGVTDTITPASLTMEDFKPYVLYLS
jgi:hypothetical protein